MMETVVKDICKPAISFHELIDFVAADSLPASSSSGFLHTFGLIVSVLECIAYILDKIQVKEDSMNPLGFIVILLGILMLFGEGTTEKEKPVHKQLNDSFKAELEELDRMEKQIREEVKR